MLRSSPSTPRFSGVSNCQLLSVGSSVIGAELWESSAPGALEVISARYSARIHPQHYLLRRLKIKVPQACPDYRLLNRQRRIQAYKSTISLQKLFSISLPPVIYRLNTTVCNYEIPRIRKEIANYSAERFANIIFLQDIIKISRKGMQQLILLAILSRLNIIIHTTSGNIKVYLP